jgi:hypothetical protein
MKIYPPGPGESDQQWFAEMANPHGWLITADNLFEQCVRLHAQKGRGYLQFSDKHGRRLRWDVVDRSMFLLGGFALENAIKAFLVYENPRFVEGGRLAKQLKSHRLVELKRLSSTIPMPKRSESVIAVFEGGIDTWSRYPCGLTAHQTDHQRWFTPELWQSYCGLMRRYGRKLQSHLEKGWSGPHGAGGKWEASDMSFLDVDAVRL